MGGELGRGRTFHDVERDHRHSGQRPTGEHVVPAATEGEGEHEGAKVGEEDLLLLLIRLRAGSGGVEAAGERLIVIPGQPLEHLKRGRGGRPEGAAPTGA